MTTSYPLLSLLLLGGILLGITIDDAGAAPLRTNPDVSVSLSDTLFEASPGDTIMVSVRITIDERSRMYTEKLYPDLTFAPVPLTIAVGGDTHLVQAGPAIADALPVIKKDKFFNAELEYWVGSVLLHVPVVITGEIGRTYGSGGISIEFMTCDEKACHPPETVRLPFTVVTVDDAVR